jgi:L-lactate dehydrogenase complex protein LldG
MVGAPVSAAREEILRRIRDALADVPQDEAPDDVGVPREYEAHDPEATVARFVERLRDYGTVVHEVGADGVSHAVGEACRGRGVARVVVPADLPEAWRPDEVEAVVDRGLDAAQLDGIGAAVTASALAIAETGTIVLDCGRGQGRRLLSLVPDVHVCIVRAEQVVGGVPSAMRRIAAGLRESGRPVTFVSGPSATSDIELSRVEGVHGPRRFDVVLVHG